MNPPNEHMVPFGLVTWERLERGIMRHVMDLRRNRQMGAFDRLPGGWMVMHPADRIDLFKAEPTDMARFTSGPYWTDPYGYQLVTTTDPARVRRGRPCLHLNDGTDVLL